MKNISVIIIALIALAFTQCKPNEDDGGEVRSVNVRCVMPIGSGERSEFANMLEEQKAMGEIPIPREVREQVEQQMNGGM